MKVLGLIDSFKGSLSSIELGKILKDELNKKNIECEYIPISDGGEGFLDQIEYLGNVERIYVDTVDPLFRKLNTYYLVDKKENTVYLEYAKCCGVSLLNDYEYNPYLTSSYGFGLLINDAIKKGYNDFVIGIGGSITNDGGSGLLEALGVKFYDKNNRIITDLQNDKLRLLNRVDFSNLKKNINITVVSDVSNPILGKGGATYTYSLQKGAKLDDLEILESNMANYVGAVERALDKEIHNLPGSGAAGGVGFALLTFLNCKLIKGIDFIFKKIDFTNLKNNYDYIITGEGKIDKQSLFGKVVFEITKEVDSNKVIILSAVNDLNDDFFKTMGITKYYSIVDKLATKEESLKYPEKYFRRLVGLIEFNNE